MSKLIREAMHYTRLSGKTMKCELCPRYCVLTDAQMGFCRSRQNEAGTLYAINYGQTVAMAMDRIEKKPLYHYYPGSKILSLGPNSCNLSCRFCQNYQISQHPAPVHEISPEALRASLEEYAPDSLQVAFTYTEPLTWYEYILDFAALYPEVRIVLISNGYLNAPALAELLPFIGAMNIDLKAMQESFYSEQCGGHLAPVLQNILACVQAGVHLELCFLLIPGLNDAKSDILAMVDFIAALNPEIPLHISAYHPDYQMNNHATQLQDVERAIVLAKTKLYNVYGGNLSVPDYMQSTCRYCGEEVISRSYGGTQSQVKADAQCPKCQGKVYGVYGL